MPEEREEDRKSTISSSSSKWEREQRILKRKNEWKKVLSEGKEEKPQPQAPPSIRSYAAPAAASSNFRSERLKLSADEDYDGGFKENRRIRIQKERQSLLIQQQQERQVQGELIRSAKRQFDIQDEKEAERVVQLALQARQEREEHQRERARKAALERKAMEEKHKALAQNREREKRMALEQEMAAPYVPPPPPRPPTPDPNENDIPRPPVVPRTPSPKRKAKPPPPVESMDAPDDNWWLDMAFFRICSGPCCTSTAGMVEI